MNWPAQSLIYAVTICLVAAISAGWSKPGPIKQPSECPTSLVLAAGGEIQSVVIPKTGPSPVGNFAPAGPGYDGGPAPASFSSTVYTAITGRNIFGLKPLVAANPSTVRIIEPKQDLVLAGLIGVGGTRLALFQLLEQGKPPSSFMLQEGEQNEWLEIRSIEVKSGRVLAFLKRPVVRIHNEGIEVILSFETHGAHR